MAENSLNLVTGTPAKAARKRAKAAWQSYTGRPAPGLPQISSRRTKATPHLPLTFQKRQARADYGRSNSPAVNPPFALLDAVARLSVVDATASATNWSDELRIHAGAIRRAADEENDEGAGAAFGVPQLTGEANESVWHKCPSLRADEGGVVRVARTRVSLDVVVEQYEKGMTPERIVRAYDALALADVRAVISFYLRHREEVRAYLARRDEEAATLRARIETNHPRISRKELLARRKAKGKADAAAGQ